VFTNHTRYDLYTQAYLPMLPDGAGDVFMKTFIPGFCNSIDRVIAPSEGIKKVLERVGVTNRIDVVPNGVDLSRFRQDIAPIPRAELGFGESDVILVYTGRLAPEKDLPFLLRAFNGAAQAYPDIRLLIVGGGPELENLQDRVNYMGIEDKVHFTGQVEYDQVPRYLVVGDAFVTASVTEVHPLTVIEAMASGLPVLGIESPGVGDTVTDGVDGFIIPEKDIAAFTAKMVRMATDAAIRRQMGEQARKTAQKYSYERTSQRMLEIYEEVISTHTVRYGFRARRVCFWGKRGWCNRRHKSASVFFY
jgi:glycosyltransferase involved in cell wall biosynthesis